MSNSNNQNNFNFNNLFVFDLANNHQGDTNHAINIIKSLGKIVEEQKVKAVFKFQFRELNSFIHPDHFKGSNNKHINRFVETKLSNDEFKILFDTAKNNNLLTMSTPFDEKSVELIESMNFDLIKIASCSANDWPLLEKIANSSLPIIFSTGGLELYQIDEVISFFNHRGCDYSIMHCISIYPTTNEKCNLNFIDTLVNRYPNTSIGWSTHEEPNNLDPIKIAYSKGARIFERHVGIETKKYQLNKYSSTPYQINKWIDSYKKAVSLCGSTNHKRDISELESINSLKRGVYAKQNLKKGKLIKLSDIFFSMPFIKGQLSSGEMKNDTIKLIADIKKNEPIIKSKCKIKKNIEEDIIKHAIHEVKAMLNEAKIILNSEFQVEYSHHYGIINFRKTGAVLINCVNRNYCKKIVVQLPDQSHPSHFHKIKEETFQVLYGVLELKIEDHIKTLYPGETCLIQPGVWHGFTTKKGCIFEEISSKDSLNDSFYKDKKINLMKKNDRKTIVNHWGRFELSNKLRN